jgi:hypothetical protein
MGAVRPAVQLAVSRVSHARSVPYRSCMSVAEQLCSRAQRWCALSAQDCATLTPPLEGRLLPLHATTRPDHRMTEALLMTMSLSLPVTMTRQARPSPTWSRRRRGWR